MHLSFYPSAISDLIQTLRQLPGVGLRSAEKWAFALLEWPPDQLKNFCSSIEECKKRVDQCPLCGCLFDAQRGCWSCNLTDRSTLCIVAHAKEAFAIHSTGSFQGGFYVLGGLLDPLRGIEPEQLRLSGLIEEGRRPQTQELLLALDATLEGDATALYIKQLCDSHLQRADLKISRLAFGMPINSSLELVDPATLSRAISAKSYW